jgi:serine protease Do
MVDGQPAALGAIVEPDGQIVSKASLLEGKITCRLPDGRELPAKLLGADDDSDLALLKVEAQDLIPVSWRSGGTPAVGSWVATVGQQANPLGIGVVSAEPRSVPGPRRPPARRGVLGVSLGQAGTGPRIAEVFGGSAAEKAGLKVGDIVRDIDGQPLTTIEQMIEAVGSRPPGREITLLVERDEDELRLTATLEKPRVGLAPEDEWGGGPFSQRRYGFPSAMPHDTVLSPTDCGGPLVDTDGKVVGINIARALRVTSYAIPADVARKVLAELKKKAPSD